MDVSKYMKKKNLWIFDDTFPKDVYGTFKEAKEYLTNGGKKEDVFVLTIGEDYMIMPFKLDYTDFVEKYGSNTEDWNNMPFRLTHNSKGKYQIIAIEESIN